MKILRCTRRIRPIYLILLALVHLQYCSATNNPVCTSKECKNLGNIYIQNMGNHINPCTNFYKYACNGWYAKYAKSWSTTFWDTQEQMEESMYYDLKKIMENNNPEYSEEFRKAKFLYHVNMNTPSLKRLDAASLRSIMTNVGTWPILRHTYKHQPVLQSCFHIDKKYVQITGSSAFFDYIIMINEIDYKEIITDMRRLVSPYGALLRFANWKNLELQHYLNFLVRIIMKISPPNSKPPANTIVDELHEVIEFREDIRAISKTAHPHITVDMTIREFQEWYNLHAHSKKNCEIIWLDMLRTIYDSGHPHNSTIKPTSKVKVNQIYFKQLCNLLSKTDIQVIANHIHFYFAEKHIELDDDMIADLLLTVNDSENPTGSLIEDARKWRTVLENHNMRHTLGKMYINAYFPKQKQNDINVLFEEAKRLLEFQISNSNWLNNIVKQKSIKKVKNIKNVIGYPSEYEKHGPAPSTVHNSINPLMVDIFYDITKNSITATAGHLQLPMYGSTLPFPINYGAAMSIIGHELYHAFDEEGVKFDENAKSPWWPTGARNNHKNQLQCFKEVYQPIINDKFQKYNLKPDNNTPSTLDEDYADVMGLKLAYLGYKQKLQEHKGICRTLPGFESLSCDKLFFLAYANLHCSFMSPDVKKHHLMKESHSLPEIRVNTALANIRQFSAAFGCKPKDTMKLKKTCDVWKLSP